MLTQVLRKPSFEPMKPTQRKTFAGISLVILGMFLYTEWQKKQKISRLHAEALLPLPMLTASYQKLWVILIPNHGFYQTTTNKTETKKVVSKALRK
jgi:hypothetical protein